MNETVFNFRELMGLSMKQRGLIFQQLLWKLVLNFQSKPFSKTMVTSQSYPPLSIKNFAERSSQHSDLTWKVKYIMNRLRGLWKMTLKWWTLVLLVHPHVVINPSVFVKHPQSIDAESDSSFQQFATVFVFLLQATKFLRSGLSSASPSP